MSKPIFVYLAGPYTKPDPVVNTARAIEFGNLLLDQGYRPFIPHLSMFQHMAQARPWQEWLNVDFDWIAKCDVLIRLPGDSAGADQEVALAKNLGIAVYECHGTYGEDYYALEWLEDFAESRAVA